MDQSVEKGETNSPRGQPSAPIAAESLVQFSRKEDPKEAFKEAPCGDRHSKSR
jgi:hypothetical protein